MTELRFRSCGVATSRASCASSQVRRFVAAFVVLASLALLACSSTEQPAASALDPDPSLEPPGETPVDPVVGDDGGTADASLDANAAGDATAVVAPLAKTLAGDYVHHRIASVGPLWLSAGAHYYVSGKYTFTKRVASESEMMAGQVVCEDARGAVVYRGSYAGANFWETGVGAEKGSSVQGLFAPPATGSYVCYLVAWASSFPTCTASCPVVFDVVQDPAKTTLVITADQVGAAEWFSPSPKAGTESSLCVAPGATGSFLRHSFTAAPNATSIWVDSGFFLTEDHNPSVKDFTPCNVHTSATSTTVDVSLVVTQVDLAGTPCATPQTRVISGFAIPTQQHHAKVYPSLTSVAIERKACPLPARFDIVTRMSVVTGNDVYPNPGLYASTIARNVF